jgi:pyridoxine 4-dehydrogenase
MAVPRTTAVGSHEVARVGLGTNRLRNTPENHEFLRAAAVAGVQMIDTAHLYAGGESEAAIGDALAPFEDGLVVATKGGYRPGAGRPEALRAELEESFARLRTDSISLYYLHRVDPEVPLEESLGVLGEYRDAGRIENVGISEVRVDQIERARAVLPIAAVQNEYNLAQRKYDEVIDHCEQHGIAFVPYYPLRGDHPALAEIAARHEANEQQIVLAWLLRRSPCIAPIPGTLSIEHLRDNLGALDVELADDEFAALSRA